MAAIVGLSLLAAFCFAAASAIQQRAAAREGVKGRPIALVRRLLRRRAWLAGWGVNVIGFFSQTAALRIGNVAVVQPLLTTQLLFAIPLATTGMKVRPTKHDWAGAAAVCAGLVLFLQVRGAAPLHAHPDRDRLLETIPFAGAVVGVLAAASLHPRRQLKKGGHAPRPVLASVFGVAAGVCFAYTAAFIVLTSSDLLDRGVLETAVDWPGYALAGSTALGIILEQQAFSVGTLPPALSTMTIVNPVVAYVLGIVAFHTRPPQTSAAWAGLLCSAVLVSAGVWLLANSRTAQHAMPEPAAATAQGKTATVATSTSSREETPPTTR